MRTRWGAPLLVALGAAAGCASAPKAGPPAAPVTMQTERGTFVSAEGSRAYVVARPLGGPAAGRRAMVVVLHGCVQSADDIARGTRMTAAAAREGFVVLYPEQPASANVQRCWNWYVPAQTARGGGEVALLAAMIDSIGRREGVDPRRVAVVGMSAGAAMAANLVVAYPERFAALAMHSGIAAGAASDLGSALAVMGKGPTDGNALGDAALAAMGPRARAIPVIVIHGAADKVVSPANLPAVVAQWTRVNASGRGAPVEQHLLENIGHAWSGGAADASYTAPQGPDATGMIVEFFRRVGVLQNLPFNSRGADNGRTRPDKAGSSNPIGGVDPALIRQSQVLSAPSLLQRQRDQRSALIFPRRSSSFFRSSTYRSAASRETGWSAPVVML